MKILCFSLFAPLEHTFDGASIPNHFFVKAGGIDLSFLIIMLSMFLMIEKEKTLNSEKKNKTLRTLLPYALLYTMPCLQNQKSKKKNVSSYLLFVSSCQYLISYAT